MEKCDEEKLVLGKSDRLSFVQCDGSSDVWPSFLKVLIDGEFQILA